MLNLAIAFFGGMFVGHVPSLYTKVVGYFKAKETAIVTPVVTAVEADVAPAVVAAVVTTAK
jgi:hypothetical protein